jgi:hypothetical protein
MNSEHQENPGSPAKQRGWHIQTNVHDVYLCHPTKGCMSLFELDGLRDEHIRAAKRIAEIYNEALI